MFLEIAGYNYFCPRLAVVSKMFPTLETPWEVLGPVTFKRLIFPTRSSAVRLVLLALWYHEVQHTTVQEIMSPYWTRIFVLGECRIEKNCAFPFKTISLVSFIAQAEVWFSFYSHSAQIPIKTSVFPAKVFT